MPRFPRVIRRLLCAGAMAVGGLASPPAQAQNAADVQFWDAAWAAYQALQATPIEVRGDVRVTQEISIDIQAPRPHVFDVYANVHHAQGLHPFLVGIVPIRCRRAPATFDFTALENVPFNGTTLQLLTVSRQTFDRPRSYTADTFDFPGIVTHQRVRFDPLPGGGTRVTEQLTFEAPPVFIDVTVQGGVFAHTLVQQGLKTAIEASLSSPVKFPDYVPLPCPGHDVTGNPR